MVSGGPQADLGPWPLKVSKKHCLGAAIFGTLRKSKKMLVWTPHAIYPQKVLHWTNLDLNIWILGGPESPNPRTLRRVYMSSKFDTQP